LEKVDIPIRDNKTGEIMKIVKDGDSESMIGVYHPEKGILVIYSSKLSIRGHENMAYWQRCCPISEDLVI